MSDKNLDIQITTDSKDFDKTIIPVEVALKKMDHDAGLLGKLFGGKENAPIYVVCLTTILFVSLLIFLFCIPTKYDALECLHKIETILLPMLGFLFGKCSR